MVVTEMLEPIMNDLLNLEAGLVIVDHEWHKWVSIRLPFVLLMPVILEIA